MARAQAPRPQDPEPQMQDRRDPQLRGAGRTSLGFLGAGAAGGFGDLRTVFYPFLPLSSCLLLAQAEAPLQLLRPGAGQARAVTAQRNKPIHGEARGEDLGQAATNPRGQATSSPAA